MPPTNASTTDDYLNAEGRADVLERYGISPTASGCALLIGSAPHAGARVTEDDVQIARLGSLPQSELWSSANRVQVTAEFQELSDKLATEDDGAEALAQVEQRRRNLDEAVETQQQTQTNLLRVSAVALLACIPVTLWSSFTVVPLLALAAGLDRGVRAEGQSRPGPP